MSALLEVEHLAASYGAVRALRDVSFAVGADEAVAVLGANGAGKSTLLFSITGVLKPVAGHVRIDGSDVTGAGPEAKVRQGLSLVPERRQLFATLSVLDNLTLGAYSRKARTQAGDDLERVYALFPVLAQRSKQSAGTLSGGEQQMLAIGRGLMARPRLLAIDELSLGLAPLVVEQICDTLAALRGSGLALLLMEQNARAAMALADRVLVMERGLVVAEGTPAELSSDERIQRAYLGAP